MKSGFVQLQSDRYNTGASKERLFYHTAEGDHYTTASAAQQDPEMGIPLHQIHIREEVKIDAQRRP